MNGEIPRPQPKPVRAEKPRNPREASKQRRQRAHHRRESRERTDGFAIPKVAEVVVDLVVDPSEAYYAEVRQTGCSVERWVRLERANGRWVYATPCSRRMHAHHHTEPRGVGQKAAYDETMCMCRRHHRELHRFKETFDKDTRGWDQPKRAKWQWDRVHETRDLVRCHGSRRSA